MGGIGSGRKWHWGAKDTTENYRRIDVRRWARERLLDPGQAFTWQWRIDEEPVASIKVRVELGQVHLIYRHRDPGGDWTDEDYPVYLDTTACHLGGARQWFRCPAHRCGRRVAMLYGGAIFACRDCHQLAYPSQREDFHDRASRKAERIRHKLGWEPGIANGHGMKPKGMHWRTFDQLCAEHDAYDQASWSAFLARYGAYLSQPG